MSSNSNKKKPVDLQTHLQNLINDKKFKKKDKIINTANVRNIKHFLPQYTKNSQVLKTQEIKYWRQKLENHLKYKGMTESEIKSTLNKVGFSQHLRKVGQLKNVFENLRNENFNLVSKTKDGGFWLYSETEKFVRQGILDIHVSELKRFLDQNPDFLDFDIKNPQTWTRELMDYVVWLLGDFRITTHELFEKMVNGLLDHDPRYEGWWMRFLRALIRKYPVFDAIAPSEIADWINNNFF